jgi:hypothetical protein
MRNLVVSEAAINYVNSQNHILNPIIVIYRDIAKFGCWYSAKPVSFILKAKVIDEMKINESLQCSIIIMTYPFGLKEPSCQN